MFQETMEAMKIMGIPDEEQIGMNLLKGLKMQGDERGNGSYLSGGFVFWGSFFGWLVWFGFFVGFVLSGGCALTHMHSHTPAPSEQCASNKHSGFRVTHLRIYQHSFSLYS